MNTILKNLCILRYKTRILILNLYLAARFCRVHLNIGRVECRSKSVISYKVMSDVAEVISLTSVSGLAVLAHFLHRRQTASSHESDVRYNATRLSVCLVSSIIQIMCASVSI